MNLGGETEYVEHKRSTGEHREAMESIASILNKHGRGTLYFGVRNDGEVVGQDVSGSTLRQISQEVGNRIEPRIYPEIEALDDGAGRHYIRVSFSGSDAPYSCDGRYRVRRADEDVAMTRAMLQEMMREAASRTDPWDGRDSGRPVGDADEGVLMDYVGRGLESGRIPFRYAGARDTLSRLGLLSDAGTLTNAAATCFAPSRDVALRMGVFADSSRVHILDNRQSRGTLFSLVAEAEAYILNNTRRAFVIDGSSMHRREVPEVPRAAVREALLNAFAHREYEDDAAVQVDIFWDRVDIYSPGLFPPGYGPDDYTSGAETASKPRNRLIANTLYRSGDIETYGTGLQRIGHACAAAGVPFSVTQSAHGVHVCFARSEGARGRPAGPGGAGPAKLPRHAAEVMGHLREAGPSSASEVAAAVSLSTQQARRVLSRLVGLSVVVRTGASRSTLYSLSDSQMSGK